MAENVSGHIPVKTLVLKDAPVREVPNGAIALVDENGDPIDIGGGVSSVNGQTGSVTLSASDVGAATSAQGGLADSAVQPGDLATVATTGAYGDLTGTPTLGTAAAADASAFATAAQGGLAASAVQPGDLPTFGTAASADTGDFLAAPAGAVPAYSVDPADLAAALVRAGLMQAGGD